MSTDRSVAYVLLAMGIPPMLMALLAFVRAEWVDGLLCGGVTLIWFTGAWLFVVLDKQKRRPASEPPPK